MKAYLKYLKHIKKSKNKEKAILDLWRYLGDGDFDFDEKSISHIKRYITSIYDNLNFNQKHAALQVLLKIRCGDEIRDLIFDYLGKVYVRYIGIAGLMSNYLHVMRGFEGFGGGADIGPWELDKTLAATREKLKRGNSPYV